MKSYILAGGLLFGTLSAGLMAADVMPVKGKVDIQGVTKVMTVTRVDQSTREIALRSDGMETTYIAGPEIRNFAQIEAGDKLTLTSLEALAVRVYPVSEAAKGNVVETEISRAPLGSKPYGMITRRVTLSGRLEALDKQARTAVIEGKHGSLHLQLAEEVNLSNVEVKDQVRVDYLDRLSITVESPK